MMTKKDFIAIADHIRYQRMVPMNASLSDEQVESIADFLASQNPRFNRQRWLGYVAGTNGANDNGGEVKDESKLTIEIDTSGLTLGGKQWKQYVRQLQLLNHRDSDSGESRHALLP